MVPVIDYICAQRYKIFPGDETTKYYTQTTELIVIYKYWSTYIESLFNIIDRERKSQLNFDCQSI